MLRDLLSYMNFTFTMCFTFECVLKLIAFGPGVSIFKIGDKSVSNVEKREKSHFQHLLRLDSTSDPERNIVFLQ